ncbi:hypothetical protein [Helicobacter trogontum]|uniref:hypothetical protein n=1 Tax=Helicobacter trogontum TaxID=50960 RepID=UPI0018831C7A|nr:hypothetical protein [Helicobacter trogontum]
MKYFILIFISLITLVIITSCGLIRTSSADKEKMTYSPRINAGVSSINKSSLLL